MNQNLKIPGPRDAAQQKYNSARGNLLLMIIFTAVNLVFLIADFDLMFLFSATIPYQALLSAREFDSEIVGWFIAILFLGVFLLCWYFSQKNYGWMIGAMAIFAVDCGVLLLEFLSLLDDLDASIFIDLFFHGFVLYCLINGVINGSKLRTLPPDPLFFAAAPAAPSEAPQQTPISDSPALYAVDPSIEAKVYLSAIHDGHLIQYRRVQIFNELVIDTNVYAYAELKIENPHTLQAMMGGHLYEVGTDNTSHTFIRVDGITLEQKLRWI